MAKRKVVKAKAVKKTAKKSASRKKAASVSNHKAYWDIYKDLQKRVDKAWLKLKSDVKKKAKPQVLLKDKTELLLLLGECNYMARECMRIARKGK
jgi:hypothetical protein